MNKTSLSMSEFIKDLSHKLSEISESSLKMKISNIRQVLEERKINNSLATKPFSNYSKQNEHAMNLALSKLNKS